MGPERGAIAIDPERRKEDLIREVRIQGSGHVGERRGVAIDELRDAAAIVYGAGAALAGHVERALGKAEVLLDIDEHEVDIALVRGRGAEAVGRAPLVGALGQPPGVRVIGPVAGATGIEEGMSGHG